MRLNSKMAGFGRARYWQRTYQPNELESAWLAGLFEGEGCIALGKSKYKLKDGAASQSVYPVVVMASTDKDVIDKFHKLVGFGRLYGPYWLKLSTKPQWIWRGSGWQATRALWGTIGGHLGTRRAARFQEVLAKEPVLPMAAIDCSSPSRRSYVKHLESKTLPCKACREANTKYHRKYRKKNDDAG